MRQSGRTTRIVDAAVQEFFEKGVVKLRDHDYGNEELVQRLSRKLQKRVSERLRFEHKLINGVHFKMQFDNGTGLYLIRKI